MKLSEMYPSTWLGQTDVPSPIITTIREIKQEPVKGQRATEVKIVLYFTTNLKPWILNKGNAKRLVAMYGDDHFAWIGKSIEIYTDPTVEFGGDIVGGLRLRAPSSPAPHSQNGFGPAPSGNGNSIGARWDVSDGTNILTAQTSEQVQDFLADCKMPLSAVRIKPAGAPREQAKSADQWGFVAALQKPLHDPIPF